MLLKGMTILPYIFYYVSIIIIWVIFALSSYFKPIGFKSLIIGVCTIAYSLTYDILLGSYFGLYYYIEPGSSNLYIVIAGIFLYPVLNILYSSFMPERANNTAVYTLIWIGAMLFFEYLALLTKTIVFTGWRPFPWSVITYIATYFWIYALNRYLSEKKPAFKMS